MEDECNQLDFEYGIFCEEDVEIQSQEEKKSTQDPKVNAPQQTSKAQQICKQQSQKTAWAGFFQKKSAKDAAPTLTVSKPKKNAKICSLPVKIPAVDESHPPITTQSEIKRSGKHKVGWSENYLADVLFESWIQCDPDLETITCSLCQKHP